MAGSVGESFADFEGESCRFPASKGISRIGCLGFGSGEFTQLEVEVCE